MPRDRVASRAAFEEAAARIVSGADPKAVLHNGHRLSKRERRALRTVATIAAADRTLPVRRAEAREFAELLASRAAALWEPDADEPGRWGRRVGILDLVRRAMLRPVLAGAAVLALGTGSVAVASFHVAPGSPLYPVRRTVERARLVLTFADAARAEAHLDLAEQRIDEGEASVRSGALDRARSLADDARDEIEAALAIAASLDPAQAQPIVDRAGALSDRLAELLDAIVRARDAATSPGGGGTPADEPEGGADDPDADDPDADDPDADDDEPDADDDEPEPEATETPGSETSGSSGSGSSGSSGSGSSGSSGSGSGGTSGSGTSGGGSLSLGDTSSGSGPSG